MWVNPVNFRLEVPAEAVAALEAMGFPAERARVALAADPHGVATAGAADRAVEWLLEHPVCHYMIRPLVELYGGCMVVLKVS